MPRLLFYYDKNVHAPILNPILEAAQKDGRFEVGTCLPLSDYQRSERAGFSASDLSFVPSGHSIVSVDNPSDFKADVVFIADALTHMVQGAGKIVNVGHGLLSKGQYFTDTEFSHRENLADLLLVPGKLHYHQLVAGKRVFIPLAVGGYPKLDKLFQPGAPTRDDYCRMAALDPARKIVLFAPTFNISLSAIPILWTRIKALATDDRYLLIKLHNSTIPEFVEGYEQLVQQHENIKLIADLDITPYIQMADVMVSDVSSAWMEFILLDKPVVLFDNPNQQEYVNYDPRDLEYAQRDVGLRVTILEETIEAVDRSLANPTEFSARRKALIETLGIPLDGKSSERAIDLALETLDGRSASRRAIDPGRIALFVSRVEDVLLTEKTIELARTTGGESFEVWIATSQVGAEGRSRLERAFGDSVRLIDSVNLSELASSVDFVAVIPESTTGDERWLFRLVNHLRRDPNLASIVPLCFGGASCQVPATAIGDPKFRSMTPLALDRKLKRSLVGKRVPFDEPPRRDAGVLRSSQATEVKLGLWIAGRTPQLFDEAELAVDVVLEFPPASYSLVDDEIEASIATLARLIALDAITETPEERAIRLKAEECLKLARWKQSVGDSDAAVKWAQETINLRPDCLSAQVIVHTALQPQLG